MVIILAWGGLLAAKSISAYHHDQQGLDSLEQVKSNLTPDSVTTSSSVKLLDQAQAEFASAQSDLSSPLFAPITIVPVIGRQFRAVRDLSTAAGTVCQVGSTFLSQVHDRAQPAPRRRSASGWHRSDGWPPSRPRRVTQLATINTGPSQALIGPLASKHNEFVDQLASAQDRLVKAAAVSAAVATILQGPQNYVVLAGNNAEMRAGYGTWLDVGTATTSNGSIQLGDLGPSGEKSLPAGRGPGGAR